MRLPAIAMIAAADAASTSMRTVTSSPERISAAYIPNAVLALMFISAIACGEMVSSAGDRREHEGRQASTIWPIPSVICTRAARDGDREP